jgi:WD40 repeat protein
VVFDVDSGRETHSIPDAPYVSHLFFSPDGTRLAGTMPQPARPGTPPKPPKLAVWTVADGRMLFHVETELASFRPNVVWSPDGTRLLLVNGGSPSRIGFELGPVPTRFSALNAANGQLELTVNPAERGGLAAERPDFSPDGRRIACGVQTRQGPVVKLWDAATGRELLALHHSRGSDRLGRSSYWAVAFSADGHRLLDFLGTEWIERAPDGNGSRPVGSLQVTTFDATPRPEAERP